MPPGLRSWLTRVRSHGPPGSRVVRYRHGRGASSPWRDRDITSTFVGLDRRAGLRADVARRGGERAAWSSGHTGRLTWARWGFRSRVGGRSRHLLRPSTPAHDRRRRAGPRVVQPAPSRLCKCLGHSQASPRARADGWGLASGPLRPADCRTLRGSTWQAGGCPRRRDEPGMGKHGSAGIVHTAAGMHVALLALPLFGRVHLRWVRLRSSISTSAAQRSSRRRACPEWRSTGTVSRLGHGPATTFRPGTRRSAGRRRRGARRPDPGPAAAVAGRRRPGCGPVCASGGWRRRRP
jgi:hypothetical protein